MPPVKSKRSAMPKVDVPSGESVMRGRMVTSEDVQTRAREAVRVFRTKMMPIVQSYVRALTRDPSIRVELTAGTPCTDGKRIFLRPPIALGDKAPHDKPRCGRRDENGVQQCPACRVFEDVLIVTCHEVAHIVYGTFDPVVERDAKKLVERAIEEAGADKAGKRAAKIAERLKNERPKSYIEMASLVSPFLPTLINALEDARVNTEMYRARPGTYKMFRAHAIKTFEEGIEHADGSRSYWRDAGENAQMLIGIFCKVAGLPYEGWFSPEVEAALSDRKLEMLCKNVQTARSAKSVYRQSFPILERLRELGYCKRADDPEDDDEQPIGQQQQQQQQCQQGPSPEDQDGQPSDQAPEKDEEQGDGASGDDSQDGAPGNGQGTNGDGDEDDAADAEGDQGSGDAADSADDAEDGADDAEDGDGASADSAEDGADDAEDGDTENGGDAGLDGDASGDGDGDGDGDEDELDYCAECGEVLFQHEAERGTCDTCEGVEHHDDDEGDDEAGDDADSDATSGLGVKPADEYDGKGSPTDTEDLLRMFGGHNEDGSVIAQGKPEEQFEINRAIVQGEYFDEPSRFVYGVNWYRKTDTDDLNGRRYAIGIPERLEAWQRKQENCDFVVDEGVLMPAVMRGRVVFADNQRASMQRDLRTGRINARTLGRRVPLDDGRIFQKKTVPASKDYFVLIALDNSGSTQWGVIDIIRQAAYYKAELLNRLGIKFAVIAHNGGPHGYDRYWGWRRGDTVDLDLVVIKDPDEPWNAACREMLRTLMPGGNNLDGHNMEQYRKILERRPETDRILMYYTDGEMPALNHDEEARILERELKTMRRLGITVMGVGIGTDSPRRYGLDTVVLNEIGDVPKVVRELESRVVKRTS